MIIINREGQTQANEGIVKGSLGGATMRLRAGSCLL